ncbi:MAG: hypothetical protein IJW20_03505 [Clostridia bacterium]|nr:hypothetical protein [Clostridia bacterium]
MNFLKYLISHWRRMLALIIFMVVSSVLFLSFSEIGHIPENIQSTEQIITIFGITLQNWGTILAIFGTIATLFWAMYEYDKRRVISQQEKAAEIADIFSTEIVEKLSIISDVLLDNNEFSSKFNQIDSNKINRFDVYELQEMLGENRSIEEIETFVNSVLDIIESEKTQESYIRLLEERYKEEEIKRFPNKFLFLIITTLNRLEYLCMNISSNAAGSQFIYQSLHQIFLQTIHILYIFISSKNRDSIDKYNTNIIEVYNMWNKEKIKRINKHNKTMEKIHKTQQKMDKEIKKLLHIKSETV